MFRRKPRRAATQTKVHKKYFSLMLVPSYTSGKTRSLRISLRSIYTAAAVFPVLLAIVFVMHWHSEQVQQTVDNFFVSLEYAIDAYYSLHEVAEQQQAELTEDVILLQDEILDEQTRILSEYQQQRQNYIDSLVAIWHTAEHLENRLREYEEYRQQTIAELGESAHIAVVSHMLNNAFESQLSLMYTFEALDGFSEKVWSEIEEQNEIVQLLAYRPEEIQLDSAEEVASNLVDYIELLEIALREQNYLFVELQNKLADAAPHIRRDRYGPRLWQWSHVSQVMPRNTPIRVTDVRTGITYNIISFSHGSHADVFPATAADTAAFRRTLPGGNWTWDTRPVWVHINGQIVAASINGMPHGGGGQRNGNNMNGHVCLHFRGSRTHNGSFAHEREHQNSITIAYNSNNF